MLRILCVRSWSPSTCPEVNDWCASNIDMNVPYEHVPRCTAPDGVDLLSKYCIECVINHFDNTTAKCEVLRDFTEECIALCDSDISYDPIFQVRTCLIVTKITLLEEVPFQARVASRQAIRLSGHCWDICHSCRKLGSYLLATRLCDGVRVGLIDNSSENIKSAFLIRRYSGTAPRTHPTSFALQYSLGYHLVCQTSLELPAVC